VELSVKDLFSSPTIAQMAEAIERVLLAESDSSPFYDLLEHFGGMDEGEARRLLSNSNQSVR
jgi:hypothetical protein